MRIRLFEAAALACVLGIADLAAAQNASTKPGADGPYPVAVGDHWTIETKDEISGEIKDARKVVVTETSAGEIAVRSDVPGTGRSANLVYDRSWNLVRDDQWRYSPNDGQGIRTPLSPTAKWKFSCDSINGATGAIWKRTGSSSVVGEERVTTKAGVFNTYVIETNFSAKNTKDPTRTNEVTLRTWYSNDIGRWVKRNSIVRQSGHVFTNQTFELTEFSHKKQ
ncbi:MAG: hypothetical protein P4M07_19385 [Xanthobacteraceae bacterium]|nr:hypothetical protein [Xanthobacteraceae bacterium]